MTYIAKNLFDTQLVKDPEFVQGNSFMLNDKIIAYRLFFNGIIEGRNNVIQVNCTEPKYEDPERDIDCKVVKISKD
jgi:hypothetical protein